MKKMWVYCPHCGKPIRIDVLEKVAIEEPKEAEKKTEDFFYKKSDGRKPYCYGTCNVHFSQCNKRCEFVDDCKKQQEKEK